jgi:acyl carrier protein
MVAGRCRNGFDRAVCEATSPGKFFDLGGDSLDAMKLVSAIETAVGPRFHWHCWLSL